MVLLKYSAIFMSFHVALYVESKQSRQICRCFLLFRIFLMVFTQISMPLMSLSLCRKSVLFPVFATNYGLQRTKNETVEWTEEARRSSWNLEFRFAHVLVRLF